MVGVLVDACGWAALMDAKLNVDSALIGVIGEFELILMERVKEELDELSKTKRNLLLSLLEVKSTLVVNIKGLTHTDDMLIKMSIENNTNLNDLRLKRIDDAFSENKELLNK